MNKKASLGTSFIRRGNLLFSVGMIAIVFILVLPLPTWMIDALLSLSIAHRGADHHADLEHQEADRLQRLPHAAAFRHALPPRPQHRDDARDPHPGRRGQPHQRLRPIRRAGQLRHRPGDLHHPDDHQFHRHHQGRGPRRGSFRALHPGRHARQADEHRCRPQRRHHLRARGARPPQSHREGSRLLRRDGRREQVRPRRRHGGRAHHRHQPHRRLRHRHRADGLSRGGIGAALLAAERR